MEWAEITGNKPPTSLTKNLIVFSFPELNLDKDEKEKKKTKPPRTLAHHHLFFTIGKNTKIRMILFL